MSFQTTATVVAQIFAEWQRPPPKIDPARRAARENLRRNRERLLTHAHPHQAARPGAN